jgi:hypothetical protein
MQGLAYLLEKIWTHIILFEDTSADSFIEEDLNALEFVEDARIAVVVG